VRRSTESLETALLRVAGHSVQLDRNLSEISRWQVGGPARAVVEPESAAQARAVIQLMAGRAEAMCVVGDMSNVLFSSSGYDGVILRIGRKLSAVTIEGNRVTAESGVAIPDLARRLGIAGLRGLEHTVGIPGTLGGLVTMNGGSQRKGIGSNVTRVNGMKLDGTDFSWGRDECKFSYRGSTLQRARLAVLSVELELASGDSAAICSEMDRIVESRRSRFPEHLPNCGSTFLSNPAMYQVLGAPGAAIEAAGLKGTRRGGAIISPQHANFIVNEGGASSDDILYLIALVRHTVQARTGYAMDCEVKYFGRSGTVVPAHEAALDRWATMRELEMESA
jgi:UDP-N-acetylmuramate dehydrogenase